MTTIPKTDKPYLHKPVTEVRPCEGGWEVGFDGWFILAPNVECPTPPTVGETVELFGRGVGYAVRGIVIGGRVYRYLTEEQEAQRHKDEVAASKSARRETLEVERADRDRRIAALPPEFQTRLKRFHAVGGDEWRAEFEPYELFVCEEAVKIVEYTRKRGLVVGQRDVVDNVLARASDAAVGTDLLREVLGETYDEHSGNTMSAAVGLANAALKGLSLEKVHGALCNLVGCADYKCWNAGEVES